MKSTKAITLLFIFIRFNGFCQIDAIKIASAKKAIENKDYQIALDALGEVSNAGKKSKMYFYYKGVSHFDLLQYDSSEVYLKKYLILDINNEEIADKLATIDYQKKKIAKGKLEEERKKTERENCIKNCIKCNGTGTYKKNYYEKCAMCYGKGERCTLCNLTGNCYSCNGTGQLSNYNKFTGESYYFTCEACGGNGKCTHDHNCKRCNSTGTIQKEKDATCYHPDCR
jgi:hypothetical protein